MKNDKLNRLEKHRNILYGVLGFSLFVTGTLHSYFHGYPPKKTIINELYSNPRRTPTSNGPFDVRSDGLDYTIIPRFDYELYGMVVSVNKKVNAAFFQKIFGYYDYLNVNDLCVIWGENIGTGVYELMNFSQGAYTCYPEFKKKHLIEARREYRYWQLSHNHLLAVDKRINKELLKVKRGDQIYFRGNLAAYYLNHLDKGYLIRDTSITTMDSKCETVYLKDFKILRPAYPVASQIKKWLIRLAVLSLLGLIAVHIQIGKAKKALSVWTEVHLHCDD